MGSAGHHRRHRRLLSSPLSEANLRAVEPLVKSRVQLAMARIREAYRGLSEEQIELASLYARANPLQGRPPERPMLGEARVIARLVVERRQPTA